MENSEKRTVGLSLPPAKKVSLENVYISGGDDAFQVSPGTDLSVKDVYHRPGRGSKAPEDSYNPQRHGTGPRTGKGSSKLFSLPQRRRPSERLTPPASNRYYPAICENSLCNNFFASTFPVAAHTNARFIGSRGGYCALCGKAGRVVDGVYDATAFELFAEVFQACDRGYLDGLISTLREECRTPEQKDNVISFLKLHPILSAAAAEFRSQPIATISNAMNILSPIAVLALGISVGKCSQDISKSNVPCETSSCADGQELNDSSPELDDSPPSFKPRISPESPEPEEVRQWLASITDSPRSVT